jgi:hypothetical protein
VRKGSEIQCPEEPQLNRELSFWAHLFHSVIDEDDDNNDDNMMTIMTMMMMMMMMMMTMTMMLSYTVQN